ncbi:TIGR00153 family protein [bacterium]|nr:TIGR00153 family protein [bacterium]MBU3930279.1 TIGR00153 family protein [bacterium]MBU4122789.1 TIGR00153 family protein [bacterium]MDO9513472.1 TIGR00153 family protein [Elusimicrobiota bacterium]
MLGFGRKKEKEVRVLICQHLESVRATVEEMKLSMNEYLAGDIKNAKENGFQAHRLEKVADAGRREIIEKLHKGAFLPVFREDLIRLVAQQDKIADRAESCCDFFLTQRPAVPEKFMEQFKELMNASATTITPYVKAIENMFSDYTVVKTNIREVNTQEEKADTVEWHLTRDIFCSDLPLAEKLHLRRLISHVVCISDVIEDAADDLDILMVKYQI